jgi:YidC/Oxa1 family membrane protein insertase
MQTKLTSSTNDQTQRMMLYMMPLFIGWISLTLPSGLVLYWVTSNLLGFAQQFFVNRQVAQAREGAPSK